MKIKLVNQKCDESCVAACIAMVANKEFDEVMELVEPGQIPMSHMEMDKNLVRLGVLPIRRSNGDNTLYAGRVYVVDVPSLNIIGGAHAITVKAGLGGLSVYDPQTDRPGKKWYGHGKGSTELKTWFNPVECVRVAPAVNPRPELKSAGGDDYCAEVECYVGGEYCADIICAHNAKRLQGDKSYCEKKCGEFRLHTWFNENEYEIIRRKK